jgi:4-amino-4-deoxy-L-arabinose transferase-like glycosyltransferase
MLKLNNTFLNREPSLNRSIFISGLLLLVLCALFLATTLRYNDSFSIDEPYTAYRVNFPLQQMLTLMWGDNQQPLYYIMLRPWRAIFGESEIALRSLSTIFFCGTIIVTSLAGRALYGSIAGLVAGAVVAFSSLGLLYAATARPYMLLAFFVALYCWVTILWTTGSLKESRLPIREDAIYIFLLGIIGALGLLSHSIFVFTLAAFSISALALSWRYAFRFGLAVLTAIFFFLLIWGPSFIHALSLHSQNSYYGTPGIPEYLAGYANIVGRKKSLALLAVFAILFIQNKKTINTFFKMRINLLFGMVVILSVLLPVIVSQVNQVYLPIRTPIIALPALALVLAGLLVLFQRGWAVAVTILLLSAASFYYSLTQWLRPMEPQFKDQVAYVLEESECGDMIISVGMTEGEVSYYLRTLQAPDCLTHETFPAGEDDCPWEMVYVQFTTENHPDLAREAESLINMGARQGARRYWIFAPTRSGDATPTKILREKANESLKLIEETPGHGTFNDVLLYYERLN